MKGEVILSNKDCTVGFLYFNEFKGVKADIDLQYLKDAIKNIEDFEEKGLVPVKITLGIETEKPVPGTVVFFLDKKQKCGIAIAPIIDNEEEPDE